MVSKDGFVSVVADRDDKGVLVVRARDREALERLLKRAAPLMEEGPGAIEDSATTDYRRVRLPRSVAREAIAGMVADISYDNVKTAVSRSRGARYRAVLARAWAVFLDLQEPRAEGDGVRKNGAPNRRRR